MNNEKITKKLTVYLFLDENLIVGLLLKKLLTNKNIINDQNYSLLIDGIKKSKEVKEMINELYNMPIKVIALESSLDGAIEKIKDREEYRRYNINSQKIEELKGRIYKRKYKNNHTSKEYYVRIDGIGFYVVTKDVEKKYVEEYDKKYRKYDKLLKGTFDNGDLNVIKTLVSYADKRNGKGIYIFLTLDKRIIKKFSNYLSRLVRRRIYILSPEDLYKELKNLKDMSNLYYFQEILYILTIDYISNSLKRNGKR